MSILLRHRFQSVNCTAKKNMADIIQISCPECDRAMKVPASGVGKKVRCKGCDHGFVIEAPRSKARASATKKSPPAAKRSVAGKSKPKPAKAKKPTKPIDDDDEDANPYGIEEMDEAHRCPNCANKMSSEDAIICLECGFNIRSRELQQTKKVYDKTGGDRFLWLLPGILCVIGILVLIGYDLYHHFQMPRVLFDNWDTLVEEDGLSRPEAVGKVEGWYSFLFHPGIELWLFIISAFCCFFMGRFAYKRLVKENIPPDVIKEDKKKE